MKHTKNLRIIPVKTLLGPDEFLEFEKECAEADVKHSPLLRNLALGWMAERKNNRRSTNSELPACGHNMSISYSGRSHGQVNYGATRRMNRRL